MMAYMTLGSGLSVITETVFENRFMHVGELTRMGADIHVQGNNAVVKGIQKLRERLSWQRTSGPLLPDPRGLLQKEKPNFPESIT